MTTNGNRLVAQAEEAEEVDENQQNERQPAEVAADGVGQEAVGPPEASPLS